ncbi:MAG TPA: type II 3-dehydroquinate dehydratase [Gammaproteobacteria bacterium]|jgi:3-dehydroquinate dehydratase-2|nr:type II 3-dehydroquinate dehydratase [Gammaproteobacteria bacterium]
MSKTILVLNGPNLNLLGTREPQIYGSTTLSDVEQQCVQKAADLGYDLIFRQSNHEGELVDWLQEARDTCVGIVINPGAYTHTSIAIMDAIAGIDLPVAEVHISNVHKREAFRQVSYVSKVALGVIAGFGVYGYLMALEGLANHLEN